MKQFFGLGLIEITLLIYGIYLLQQEQYLTLLILLLLSLILIMKGVQYKESVLLAIVFILFITQYHRYFPYRNLDDNKEYENESQNNNNEIEHFRNREFEDLKLKAEKIERRKKRKERKKIKKRLEKEISKNESNLPIQYLKNKVKINKKTDSWSDSLGKWYLFKENFLLLLNN